jgi:VWFA-related protein
MFRLASRLSFFLAITLQVVLSTTGPTSIGAAPQSAKGGGSGRRPVTLNVIVHAKEGRVVTRDDFDLYDSGIPQEVETFSRIDAGSRIVLVVDSSSSLKVDLPTLQKAAGAVVNELYADDQMMVVGYNDVAEILEDMTPELSELRSAPAKLVRKGVPDLFDAIVAVADSLAGQAKTGLEKRAIILISDGYDSESKTKFEEALNSLQDGNIVLYAIQVHDRTRGALLRDKPKPPAVLEMLTVGTGGAIFPFEEADEAAKGIADDLRKNWYRLTYVPSGVNTLNKRGLLLMPHDKGLELRTKGSHAPRYRPPV